MRTLAFIGFLAVLSGIAVLVFFLGGFYSVAANVEDPGIVGWALVQVRSASIIRHASDPVPADFSTAAQVQAGARAFAAQGCATCHGGPGVAWAKFSEGINPGPPDLKDVAGELSPQQIFWVIRNGIGKTAMPSFSTIGVPDAEIWSIAAFVKKIGVVTEADYAAWTAVAAAPPAPAAPPAGH